MNLTSSEAVEWFRVARPLLEPLAATRDLFVLPPFPSLSVARDALAGSGSGWGVPDLQSVESGYPPGDVSPAIRSTLVCTYVGLGQIASRRDPVETHSLGA